MHYNLVNEYLHGKMNVKEPKIGMCATMFCGTDRWPMIVTEIISPKVIRVDYMSNDEYDHEKITTEDGVEFFPNYMTCKHVKINEDMTSIVPEGKIYTLRKNGRWMPKGHGMWETGAIMLGVADMYRDPDF